MLAGETIARQVRIHDGVGLGQLGPRQVMVGDEDAHPGGARRGHPFEARDAVIDGHEEVGSLAGGHRDDLGREPIAVFEAVGDEEAHVGRAQGFESPDRDGAGGGAIGVEVRDDQDAGAFLDGLYEESDGLCHPMEPVAGQEARKRVIDLGRGAHAASGIDAREHGMEAPEIGGSGDGAPDDAPFRPYQGIRLRGRRPRRRPTHWRAPWSLFAWP